MKRNKFSLSHYKLLSCDMGELIPLTWYEALPGDTIQQATSVLVRAAPLVAPVMHPVQVRIHHWYVPLRLLWEDFEDFITGGPDGMDTTTPPYLNYGVNAPAVGGLADYLGMGTVGGGGTPSALPWRAYALIWNEFYRDQDLQTPVALSTGSSEDSTTSTALLNCDWEKDYFTSARPWEQKGPSITIPIGTSAPVVTTGVPPLFRPGDVGTPRNLTFPADPGTGTSWSGSSGQAGILAAEFGATTGLQTDLTGASAVTINALREAMALQRFEEARARYGSRYTEYLRYYGVRSSDARLQRPEYLGGGKQTIQFSEVLQTGAGDGSTGNTVGSLKGHGIGAVRSNRYRRFIEEHGIIMTLMSVRPKTIYVGGQPRKFNRTVKEDYYQRELEHIGQQEVLNREVYQAHSSPTGVFGYQDRYDDYRRIESSVAGEFRTTLNYWHMGRIFSSDPALNASFVNCIPTERNFASSTTDVLYCMAQHSIQARRMLSKTGKSFIF